MAQHNKIGKLGEEIACMFLTKRGFVIMERNYSKPYGEIDIIAKKGSNTHFIEVKAVSCERLDTVSRENLIPEENVTCEKLHRLKNVVLVYISEKKVEEWSFDVCAVFIDRVNKKSKVRFLESQLLPE